MGMDEKVVFRIGLRRIRGVGFTDLAPSAAGDSPAAYEKLLDHRQRFAPEQTQMQIASPHGPVLLSSSRTEVRVSARLARAQTTGIACLSKSKVFGFFGGI